MSRGPARGVLLRDRLFQVAVVVAVMAFALLAASTVGAIHVDPVTAAAPPVPLADSVLRFAARGADADIAGAVARDLFADDRRAPRRRYLMPGSVAAEPGEPSPAPTVLGTAIGSGDDFAICQVAGGRPTIVRVGEKVGDFAVIAITRSRVVFRGPDGARVAIDASKP